MKLVLVRHAEAFALGENNNLDEMKRALTPHGVVQAEKLAQSFVKMGILPGIVFTSPFLRAVQTAEPIAKALTPGTEAAQNDYLRLEELRPKKLMKSIETVANGMVVLVGHMPDLGELAGWLIGASRTSICFDKAAAAMIACGKTLGKGRGELRWLITPDWYLE